MKNFLKTHGPAVCTGIAAGISFPAWNVWPLAWVAFAPLFWKAASLSPRAAFGHFTLAGWITHSILLQWILVQVFFAGGWAVIGQQLVSLYFGLWWGAAGFLWVWLGQRRALLRGPWTIAVLWAAMECFQSIPQTTYGSAAILAHSQGPNLRLLQWAVLGGAPILALLIVFTNASAARFLREPRKRWGYVPVCLVLIIGVHVMGGQMLGDPAYASPPFRVGIFQSDFPVEMKHDPEYTEEMVRNAVEKSRVLAANERIDLMVWPEALVMGNIESPAIQREIRRFTTTAGVPLLTGSARTAPDPPRAFNSAYLVDSAGDIAGVYDKIQLAPFGEFIPFGPLLPVVEVLVPSAVGGLTPGEEVVVFDVNGRTAGPLICFEVFFPAMAHALQREGADFLAVLTNLGWFGASNAIPQEFHVARLRAIETRLPLVHAANTGVSGVFDPYGRFVQMNSAVDRFGNYYPIRRDLKPMDTIQHRLISAFDLPEPARHPFPNGPRYFAFALVGFAVVLGAIGAIPRRGPESP